MSIYNSTSIRLLHLSAHLIFHFICLFDTDADTSVYQESDEAMAEDEVGILESVAQNASAGVSTENYSNQR